MPRKIRRLVGVLKMVGLRIASRCPSARAWSSRIRSRARRAGDPGGAAPEQRLPPSLVGSVLLPIGLFWFAWTNGPNVHWVVPIIASAPFGAGMIFVFLSSLNYLIDSYTVYAASVLAANSILRSLFGAAFPLFTEQMYAGCGYQWASMILFFMALACCGIPFLFWKYGAKIREKSKYAYAGDDDGDEAAKAAGAASGASDEENQVASEKQGEGAPAPPLAAGPAP